MEDNILNSLAQGWDPMNIDKVKTNTQNIFDSLSNPAYTGPAYKQQVIEATNPMSTIDPLLFSGSKDDNINQLLSSKNPEDVVKGTQLSMQKAFTSDAVKHNWGNQVFLSNPTMDRMLKDDKSYRIDRTAAENEDNAAQQDKWGWWEPLHTIGKALSKTVPLIATKLGSMGASGIAAVGSIFDDKSVDVMTSIADNVLVKSMASAEEKLKDNFLHTYTELNYDKKGFFDKLGYSKFWTEEAPDFLAFQAAAYITGRAFSSIGLTKGVLSGATRSVFQTEAPGAIGKILEAVTGAKNIAGISSFAVNTANESMSEALGMYKDIGDQLQNTINPETKKAYTQDEIKKHQADAAAAVFKGNLAVLTFSNGLENRWVQRGLGKKIVTESGDVVLGKALKAEAAIKNPLLRKVFSDKAIDFIGKIGIGARALHYGPELFETILKEGYWEENAQNVLTRLASGKYGKGTYTRIGDDGESDVQLPNTGNVFMDFWKQLAKQTYDTSTWIGGKGDFENSSSIGASGLIGIGGSIMSNKVALDRNKEGDRFRFFKSERKEKERAILDSIDEINTAHENFMSFKDVIKNGFKSKDIIDREGNIKSKVDTSEASIGAKAEAIKTISDKLNLSEDVSDPVVQNQLRKSAFVQYVTAHLNNGTFDQFIDRFSQDKTEEELAMYGFSKDTIADKNEYVQLAKDSENLFKAVQNLQVQKPEYVTNYDFRKYASLYKSHLFDLQSKALLNKDTLDHFHEELGLKYENVFDELLNYKTQSDQLDELNKQKDVDGSLETQKQLIKDNLSNIQGGLSSKLDNLETKLGRKIGPEFLDDVQSWQNAVEFNNNLQKEVGKVADVKTGFKYFTDNLNNTIAEAISKADTTTENIVDTPITQEDLLKSLDDEANLDVNHEKARNSEFYKNDVEFAKKVDEKYKTTFDTIILKNAEEAAKNAKTEEEKAKAQAELDRLKKIEEDKKKEKEVIKKRINELLEIIKNSKSFAELDRIYKNLSKEEREYIQKEFDEKYKSFENVQTIPQSLAKISKQKTLQTLEAVYRSLPEDHQKELIEQYEEKKSEIYTSTFENALENNSISIEDFKVLYNDLPDGLKQYYEKDYKNKLKKFPKIVEEPVTYVFDENAKPWESPMKTLFQNTEDDKDNPFIERLSNFKYTLALANIIQSLTPKVIKDNNWVFKMELDTDNVNNLEDFDKKQGVIIKMYKQDGEKLTPLTISELDGAFPELGDKPIIFSMDTGKFITDANSNETNNAYITYAKNNNISITEAKEILIGLEAKKNELRKKIKDTPGLKISIKIETVHNGFAPKVKKEQQTHPINVTNSKIKSISINSVAGTVIAVMSDGYRITSFPVRVDQATNKEELIKLIDDEYSSIDEANKAINQLRNYIYTSKTKGLQFSTEEKDGKFLIVLFENGESVDIKTKRITARKEFLSQGIQDVMSKEQYIKYIEDNLITNYKLVLNDKDQQVNENISPYFTFSPIEIEEAPKAPVSEKVITPENNIIDIEAKKLDIEKRKQEELKKEFKNNVELISSKNELVIQRIGLFGINGKDYGPQKVPTQEIFKQYDEIIDKYGKELVDLEEANKKEVPLEEKPKDMKAEPIVAKKKIVPIDINTMQPIDETIAKNVPIPISSDKLLFRGENGVDYIYNIDSGMFFAGAKPILLVNQNHYEELYKANPYSKENKENTIYKKEIPMEDGIITFFSSYRTGSEALFRNKGMDDASLESLEKSSNITPEATKAIEEIKQRYCD